MRREIIQFEIDCYYFEAALGSLCVAHLKMDNNINKISGHAPAITIQMMDEDAPTTSTNVQFAELELMKNKDLQTISTASGIAVRRNPDLPPLRISVRNPETPTARTLIKTFDYQIRSPNPLSVPKSNSKRPSETIVFLDDPRGRFDAKLTRPSLTVATKMSTHPHQQQQSQFLVFFQSGLSMCVFVLLGCVALTVFVLMLTQSSGYEHLPCGGVREAQVA